MVLIPRSNPGDQLKRYLERRSGSTSQESLPLDGRPLAMRRRATLAVMGCALISAEYWVWTLIVPEVKRASIWAGTYYGQTADVAVGLAISIATVAVIITLAVQLYTEVDSRGIHRPDWAGGESILWSSVTEVSTSVSPETLQLRAGEKKITLSLLLFHNPTALIALIRRHVPADRLKI